MYAVIMAGGVGIRLGTQPREPPWAIQRHHRQQPGHDDSRDGQERLQGEVEGPEPMSLLAPTNGSTTEQLHADAGQPHDRRAEQGAIRRRPSGWHASAYLRRRT